MARPIQRFAADAVPGKKRVETDKTGGIGRLVSERVVVELGPQFVVAQEGQPQERCQVFEGVLMQVQRVPFDADRAECRVRHRAVPLLGGERPEKVYDGPAGVPPLLDDLGSARRMLPDHDLIALLGRPRIARVNRQTVEQMMEHRQRGSAFQVG